MCFTVVSHIRGPGRRFQNKTKIRKTLKNGIRTIARLIYIYIFDLTFEFAPKYTLLTLSST